MRRYAAASLPCALAVMLASASVRTGTARAALPRTIVSVGGFGRHDGALGDAWIGQPLDLAFASDGALLFMDSSYGALRRIDLGARRVTTLAGTWVAGFSGDGGLGALAALGPGNGPVGMALAPDGIVYMTDFGQHVRAFNTTKQRKRACGGTMLAAGAIATIAGHGVEGSGGDGGPALAAELRFPRGITVAPNGDVVIADIHNNRARKIDCRTGIIDRVAGNGDFEPIDEAGDSGDGGPAIDAMVGAPTAVAYGPDGALYVAEWGFSDTLGDYVGRVRRVDPQSGLISTYAGNPDANDGGDGQPADEAGLGANPSGIAFDRWGNGFISEQWSGRIRRVDAVTHLASTVVGNNYGYSARDAGRPAANAHLTAPFGMTFHDGKLYVCDGAAGWIRGVDPGADGYVGSGGDDTMFDVGTSGGAKVPYALGVDRAGQVVVAPNAEGRVRLLDRPTGGYTTLVDGGNVMGTGGVGGPAVAAENGAMNGFASDEANNLYFVDSVFQRLMRVAAQTVRGERVARALPTSRLTQVAAIPAVVSDHVAVGGGVAYVSDPESGVVFQVFLGNGSVSVLAGNGARDGSGDGGRALDAGLVAPEGLALDGAARALYIADGPIGSIWRVDLDSGTIEIFATEVGPEAWGGYSNPRQLALAGGYLYVGDEDVQQVVRFDLDDPSLQERVAGVSYGDGMYQRDLVAADATPVSPVAMAAGPDGKVYVAERVSQRVRRLGIADIRPDSYPNRVHLRSPRGFSVALLSADGFDARTIRPESVTVAGARALGGAHNVDVDGDRRLDLVVTVVANKLRLSVFDKEAAVEAWTYDGRHIVDADFVSVSDDAGREPDDHSGP